MLRLCEIVVQLSFWLDLALVLACKPVAYRIRVACGLLLNSHIRHVFDP